MKPFIIPLAAFFIVSCEVKQQKSTDSEAVLPSASPPEDEKKEYPLKIDSVKTVDSLNVTEKVTAVFKQKTLVFEGLEKTVLDSLYKDHLYFKTNPPADYSKAGIEKTLKDLNQNYYTETKKDLADYQPGSKQTWDKVSDMAVKSNQNGYLTLIYAGYGYTGGAHGYAYEQYKTADLKNHKTLQLNDIVDVDKVDWNAILLKNLGKRAGEVFEKEKLTYNQNFYFDKTKITFVYGQYEIAAYASGIIPVEVPFSEISSALKPEFKERMQIK